MAKKHYDKHDNCPVRIEWRTMKNGISRPGLYCKTHNKWIKWLSEDDAWELIDELAIEYLGPKIKWISAKELGI